MNPLIDFHKPQIAHILFATDLSETANQAFGYAVSLAESCQADVTVLHVFDKLPPNAELIMVAFLGYGDVAEMNEKSEADLVDRIRSSIERFCTHAAEQVPTCPLLIRNVIVETGHPADRILHHAGTGAYDMLVMGNKGIGLIQSALMGSVSRKVLKDSPIPVLVVPMPETN
ncbi:MAG: universal stress protein [Desulfatirhabdiaceae bacterium]